MRGCVSEAFRAPDRLGSAGAVGKAKQGKNKFHVLRCACVRQRLLQTFKLPARRGARRIPVHCHCSRTRSCTPHGCVRTHACTPHGCVRTYSCTPHGCIRKRSCTPHGCVRTHSCTPHGCVRTHSCMPHGCVRTHSCTPHGCVRTHSCTPHGCVRTHSCTPHGCPMCEYADCGGRYRLAQAE
jgi:hypothetical protein